MAVSAFPYGQFWMALAVGHFNLTSDVLKVMLTTSTYNPDVDADEFLTDVTGEVSGTGYTAGGKTLTTVTLTYDATNHRAVLGADTVTWTGATFVAHRAVLYKSTGTAATSRLIGYIDFGVDKTYTSEDFELSFSNGVLRFKGN